MYDYIKNLKMKHSYLELQDKFICRGGNRFIILELIYLVEMIVSYILLGMTKEWGKKSKGIYDMVSVNKK